MSELATSLPLRRSTLIAAIDFLIDKGHCYWFNDAHVAIVFSLTPKYRK
jgi:hypothetical protein